MRIKVSSHYIYEPCTMLTVKMLVQNFEPMQEINIIQ